MNPDKVLEKILKIHNANWSIFLGKHNSFFVLKKKIIDCVLKICQESKYPIAIVSNEEVYKVIEKKISYKIVHINEDTYKNIIIDNNILYIIMSNYCSKDKIEGFFYDNSYLNFCNIYYELEINGIMINDDIGIYFCDSTKKKFKSLLRTFLRYEAQYSRIVELLLFHFSGSGNNGILGELTTRGSVDSSTLGIRVVNEIRRYQYLSDTELKKRSLKKLIIFHLIMRDFITSYKYIDEYIEIYGDDDFRWNDLKHELDILFYNIKKAVSYSNNKNIIVNWIDNVSYFKLEHFDWVSNQLKSGINFHNAFTTMPWTTWVTRMIFSGEGVISGNLYKKGKIGEKNSQYELVNLLHKNNFKIKYSGIRSRELKGFHRKLRIHTTEYDNLKYSTRTQWYGICNLAKNKRNQFIVLHNLYETHGPYVSPWLTDTKGFITRNMTEYEKEINIKYLDKQLEWYSQFYGDSSIRIYMSDHGDQLILKHEGEETNRKLAFSEERTHVLFGVCGNIHEKYDEYRLFSYEQFPLLIKSLINSNFCKIDIDDVKYIRYENLDMYDKVTIYNRYLPLSYDERNFRKGEWQQFIGLRDKKYKYIRFFDGEELFYKLPNETDNLIDLKEHQEKITEMRHLVKDADYVNIYKENFFEKSRLLYVKNE